jgi:hypothetical protein
MQFLLLFLLRIRTVSVCLWILISLFVPLMIIKVVSHLPDCLWAGRLIFYRNSSKTSIRIKFNIVSIENIFVCISNSYIFISLYPLIVLTRNGSNLSRRTLIFQLFIHPIFLSLLRFINSLFIIAFLFRCALGRGWWRWLCSNLNIVRWEKSF